MKHIVACKRDFRVAVATISCLDAVIRKIDQHCYRSNFFEIEFKGDHADNRTVGDVYLSRIEDIAHNMAVQFITNKLFIFGERSGFFFLESEHLVFDGKIRRPSQAVFPKIQGQTTNVNASVLIEVEFEPRSLHTMHLFCMEYFRLPTVRAVLLFKFSRRNAEQPHLFTAVGVHYRRGPRGTPLVADAVSFGTDRIAPDALNGVLAAVGRALRVMPAARHDVFFAGSPPGEAFRPSLTVALEDFDLREVGWRGEVAPDGDFVIDLWELLEHVTCCDWPLANLRRKLQAQQPATAARVNKTRS